MIQVLKLVFKHFVLKRWRSIVFSAETVGSCETTWPETYRYRWYGRFDALPVRERERLIEVGAAGFLSELDADDALYVVWCGDQAASWGAVPARTNQRAVLGLSQDALLIGSCETHAVHRGRGLYRAALAQTVEVLRSQGKQAIYIEVQEDNVVSLGAIEKVGFHRHAQVDAWIVFGSLVLRNGTWRRLRQRGQA
jgi:GNAT superfamily N-acetyltransferase